MVAGASIGNGSINRLYPRRLITYRLPTCLSFFTKCSFTYIPISYILHFAKPYRFLVVMVPDHRSTLVADHDRALAARGACLS